MLVPLELYGLSLHNGFLSPELAIGWRIGTHMREQFDGLAGVRIGVAREDDACLALKRLARKDGEASPIQIGGQDVAWDFLFYHPATGSLIKWVLIRRLTRSSERIAALAPFLGDSPSFLEEFCHQEVEEQIAFLLERPVTDFAVTWQSRCRPFPATGEESLLSCHSCGRPQAREQLWEIEGNICCPRCAGVEGLF